MVIMVTVEILTIGDEVLNGDVVNTNASYLSKFFTSLGGYVVKNITVRDDVGRVSSELEGMLNEGTDLVVTTGGLGPTYDDVTLQGVAKFTKRKLVVNKEALEMVERRYEEFAKTGYIDSSPMGPTRIKMATIPEGAVPLENFVGAAPGVLLSQGETDIICLPGVPTEIKSIIESSMQNYLKRKFGNSAFEEREIVAYWKDESTLAPLIKEMADSYPDIYVKSRPKKFGEDLRIRVTFSIHGDSRSEMDKRLDSAISDFITKLSERKIGFDREKQD